MTTTTTRKRLALLWTGACIAAGIGILGMGTEAGTSITSAAAQAEAERLAQADRLSDVADLAAQDQFLINQAGQFLPGTELTLDQAREVVAEADRVCDELSLGVSMAEVTDRLMAEQDLTGEEARGFANTVGVTLGC
jgi:hypothetical protein